MHCSDPDKTIGGFWLELAAKAQKAMNDSAGVAVFAKAQNREAIW
jgi:hypothetical protein